MEACMIEWHNYQEIEISLKLLCSAGVHIKLYYRFTIKIYVLFSISNILFVLRQNKTKVLKQQFALIMRLCNSGLKVFFIIESSYIITYALI